MGIYKDIASSLQDPEGYIKTYSGILIPKEPSSESSDIDIKVYEMEGKPIKEIYDMWYQSSEKAVMDQLEKDTIYHDDGTFDVVYNQLKPRVKWFRPPLTLKIWKFEINMTWAYKIEKCYLLKNCRMVPKVDSPIDDNKEIVMNWNTFPFNKEIIDDMKEHDECLAKIFEELNKDNEEDI